MATSIESQEKLLVVEKRPDFVLERVNFFHSLTDARFCESFLLFPI